MPRAQEAQELDSGIRAKDAELESLRAQLAGLDGAAEALREASDRAAAVPGRAGRHRARYTGSAISRTSATDAVAGLRKRRQQFSKEAETARAIANQAANDRTLADERVRQSRLALDAAIAARDGALAAFPEGVDAALTAARSALAAAIKEKEEVAAGFASLEREIEARKKRIDTALSGARTNAEQAAAEVEAAQAAIDDSKDQPRDGTRAARRIAKTARRGEYGRSRGAAPGGYRLSRSPSCP